MPAAPPASDQRPAAIAPDGPSRGARALRTLAIGVFPVLIWFIATYFFFGEIGKYSDDWSLDLRRPDTGLYHWPDSPFDRWHWFWRPLHLLLLTSLGTFAWELDWLRHLLSAALHGAVAWLLYRFLRRVGVARSIAGVGALVLLVHPVVYEMSLWPSTVSAMISTVMLLVLWRRALDVSQDVHRVPRPWLLPIAWFAWTFIMACFYEQQAGLAPLAGLMVFVPIGAFARRAERLRAIKRSFWLGIGPSLACVLYIALVSRTAPPGSRGAIDRFKGAEDALRSVWASLRRAADWIAGPRVVDAATGALKQTRVVLESDHGPVLGVLLPLAFIAGLVWVGAWFARPDRCGAVAGTVPNDPAPNVNPLVIVGVSLGAGLLALVPLALISNTPPQPRLVYFPLLCAVLAGSISLDRLARLVRPSPAASGRLRWAAGLAMLSAVTLGAAAQVGFQDQFRRRSLADLDVLSQLKQLVPAPPAGTTFMPVRLGFEGVNTGHQRFDGAIPGATNLPWAAWAWIQCADGYRRRDILCTNTRPGTAATYGRANARGIHYTPHWAMPPGWVPKNGWFVEWGACIPFVVDDRNRVRLVNVLTIPADAAAAKQPLTVELPLVRSLEPGIDADRVTAATLPSPAGR